MNAFRVYIGDSDVSQFLPKDSLTSITLEAESNSIWDYRLDSIDINGVHNSIMTYLHYTGLRDFGDKEVKIYWYDRLIFSGVIDSARQNIKDQTINISVPSWGYKIAKMSPYYYFAAQEFSPSDAVNGDTINVIMNNLTAALNDNFIDWQYNKKMTPVINIEDFINYKTIYVKSRDELNEQYLPMTFYGAVKSIENGGTYLFWFYRWGGATYNTVLMPINENMVYDKREIIKETFSYDDETLYFVDIGGQRYAKYTLIDDTWPDELYANKVQLLFPECKISNKVVFSNGNSIARVVDKSGHIRFVEISYVDADRFLFNYQGGVTIGDVIRDLAFLSNGIAHISSVSDEIIINSRSLYNEVINIEENTIIEIEEEYFSRFNEDISIPDNFELLTFIEWSIKNYYSQFLSGYFITSTITVPAQVGMNIKLFDGISIGGKDHGIVKKVEYTDTFVIITAEKRL